MTHQNNGQARPAVTSETAADSKNTLIEHFGGRSLPSVKRYFADRNPLEWHREREHLSIEDGLVMTLLSGALDTIRVTRALSKSDLPEEQKIIFRPLSGRITVANGDQLTTACAYPIASVSLHPKIGQATLRWLNRNEDFASMANPEVLAVHDDITVEAQRFRIRGLDETTFRAQLHEGVLPGQERIALLTEFLAGRYSSAPIPHKLEGMSDLVWALIPNEQLGKLNVRAAPRTDSLQDIHDTLWSKMHEHCAIVGSRWTEAVESLGSARGLLHGTFRPRNADAIVWLQSPTSLAPNGQPLTLVCSGPKDSGKSGSPRIQMSWLHHGSYSIPGLS